MADYFFVKIGDLGLMTEPPQIQTTEWIRYASGRGTRAYLAPVRILLAVQ